ncbi:uncharacterized protein LOC18094092 isoform X1 [Populus trichocarpa]|uniref:uncharacterized protein LOC18094092 isoform X1 n=1 Tax=Populus trichocarpa TaxID=3694 RepID=UPI000D18B3C2|nr:uncharacterized protein LOC18094092 isoform X1 [Populus trichocarpa]|eukprot:XP_024462396.1 uncharacterized protein LOC18094092 isoform X1 [Populus trichocarpa]
MQRLCTKLRSLASVSSSHRLLHSSPQFYHRPLHFAAASSKWSLNGSLLNTSSSLPIQLPSLPFLPSFRLSPLSDPRIFALVCLQLVQVRHVSSRERKKNRKPMTPLTSKVKKFKMKAYSSYKDRFRTMNDGTIRRWREGKNHNAHLKSKKSRRRLRQPSTVPAAYAKVMKKLSFCV